MGAPQLTFKVDADDDGTPFKRENAFSAPRQPSPDAASDDFQKELSELQDQQRKREEALRTMRLNHLHGWLAHMEGGDEALRETIVEKAIFPARFLDKSISHGCQVRASDLHDAAQRICTTRQLVIDKAQKAIHKIAELTTVVRNTAARMSAAYERVKKALAAYESKDVPVRKEDLARIGTIYYDWLNDYGHISSALQELLVQMLYRSALSKVAGDVISAEFARKVLSDSEEEEEDDEEGDEDEDATVESS